MAHAASASPASVRSTPPLGTPSPSFSPRNYYDEDSQIKLRSRFAPDDWYQEDPFPLVRERVENLEEIEITFDESLFTPTPAPRLASSATTGEPSMDWRGIPAGSLAEEPAPPSSSLYYDANDVSAPRRRLSGRAIATRLFFGAILCGLVILLGYEARMLWQTGALPF